MKKTITTLSILLITFIGSSAFIFKYSSGIAGYTGAPGENSCSNPGCHAGGTSAASGITITSTPSFTNDEYVPGTTYTISITEHAAGFSYYGFGCEILNSANSNAGTMQVSGSGVTFMTASGRKNAVHSTPKFNSAGTVVFTFKWIAPSAGFGEEATIYVAANAVNHNGSSNGDFPIDPISLALTEGDPLIVTGIHENTAAAASQVMVYPNPANGLSHISYMLKENSMVAIELLDLSGKTVKLLVNEKQDAGDHAQLLNLQNVAPGVYFVKTSVNNQKAAQKLITVQ